MNNANLMRLALESGDVSDSTVSAALDALREEAGLSLLDAMREALRCVAAGAEAREIAGACSCIEEGAPHRDRLMRECRSIACVPVEENSTVFVNPGGGEPSAYRAHVPDSAHAWGEWCIYVGALWLLERAEQLTKEHSAGQTRRGNRPRE